MLHEINSYSYLYTNDAHKMSVKSVESGVAVTGGTQCDVEAATATK